MDAERLRRKLTPLGKNYAISMKGQAFPDLESRGVRPDEAGRLHVIEASSWAMANCFEVEKKLGRHEMSWYVDSRIAKRAPSREPDLKRRIALPPTRGLRYIHMFRSWIWEESRT
jgi:hypothetical protein